MKIFSALTIALLMIFQAVGLAATGTFSAHGEYLMSDYDTPEIAEEIALDFAKQNAAEQAGIYLESYSRTKNFELEADEIKTVASSKVEVLEKNISRQSQSNGRILLRADITAKVDTSELDNFIKQAREKRQAVIQRYKDLQEMNTKIKQDIETFQSKLAVIKDEVKDDELLIEQERINREFLSKQKVEEFAYSPFKNEEIKYDITRIKYDTTLIDEAIKFNPKNTSAYILQAFFASSSPDINNINKALIFTSNPKTSAALYAMRALYYLNKGDLDRTLEEYNKAIQLEPKSSTYHNIRARFYESRLKDNDKAVADYTTAIKLNPKDVDAYESRGKLYESQKKYPEAINDYKTILKLAPEKINSDNYAKIGDMYKELKDYPNALEYYTKAINLEPEPGYEFADNRVATYHSRAELYVELDEYDKAIADCDKGIELAKAALGKSRGTGLDSLLKDSYGLLISTLEDTKKDALKVKNETKILTDKYGNIDTNDIKALMERGEAYYDAFKKTYKEIFLKHALEDYTRVLKLDPKNQLAYQKRGSIYLFHLEGYKSALADFNALIKLNPNFANYRGLTYEKLGEWEKALADYNKALEINPNNEYIEENRQRVLEKLYPDIYNAESFLKEAHSLRENKDYERAIKAYTKVLERDSENQDALFYRGLMYIYKNRYALARADYERLIELNPNYNSDAYNNRGICYDELGQHNRAITDYDKAIALNPNLAEAYNNRGNAYKHLGQYERAIQDFDKAITLKPTYANAYNNRAVAYENLSKLDKALDDYDKALKLNPSNEIYKTNHQRVLDKMKK